MKKQSADTTAKTISCRSARGKKSITAVVAMSAAEARYNLPDNMPAFTMNTIAPTMANPDDMVSTGIFSTHSAAKMLMQPMIPAA